MTRKVTKREWITFLIGLAMFLYGMWLGWKQGFPLYK